MFVMYPPRDIHASGVKELNLLLTNAGCICDTEFLAHD